MSNMPEKTGQKGLQLCKYWGSEKGCRKSDACTFGHSWEGLSKQNRCFGCSGLAHGKKDCPYKKRKDKPGGHPLKAAKLKKEIQEQAEAIAVQLTASEGAKTEGDLENVASGTGKATVDSSSSARTTADDPTVALLTEATGLLKSLRTLKPLRFKAVKAAEADRPEDEGLYALLDGGATHALRQARADERSALTPVTVELAHGTTTLYRHPKVDTLLSLDAVEPIIPLRMLVEAGFKITWDGKGCCIRYDGMKELQCWMRHGCPVMKRSEALQLLERLEQVTKLPDMTNDEVWWRERFPALPIEV